MTSISRIFRHVFTKFMVVNILAVYTAAVLAHGDDHEHQPTKVQTEEDVQALLKKAQSDGSLIAIQVGDKTIVVEYADAPNERALGLMYRRQMCADCGMLFKFDQDQIGSIWMKNTYIPLDLAYIEEDGTITDIKQLAPFDLTPVKSSKPVRFALEMNLGWMAKHNIKVGQKVNVQDVHDF
jgi:uncharacterized membrane protein (UPF0127 family)